MICYSLRKERAPISDVSINRKDLSERDICSMFIGPAVKRAGWDGMMQIREEVAFRYRRRHVAGGLTNPSIKQHLADANLFRMMVARDRIEPPTPVFSGLN
jgi:type I site-specific restriction endonuclease